MKNGITINELDDSLKKIIANADSAKTMNEKYEKLAEVIKTNQTAYEQLNKKVTENQSATQELDNKISQNKKVNDAANSSLNSSINKIKTDHSNDIKELKNIFKKINNNNKSTRQEVLNLRMQLDKNKILKAIDDKSGIGFFDLFENSENIDGGNSTAYIDDNAANFEDASKLIFKQVVFDNDIENLELNIFNDIEIGNIKSNKDNVVEVFAADMIEDNKLIIDGVCYTVKELEVIK